MFNEVPIWDLISFIDDVAIQFDHDEDAHKYGTQCRQCDAQKLIERLGYEIPEWAK